MKPTNLRALVVDDDFMIAKVHAGYIEMQDGYELAGIAGNYAQTMELARNLKPDLLVLDVYLPDRSGIDVLRSLRSEKISCDVILITAAKEIGIIEESFQLGIFDYLIKPFDLDLLKDTLEKYKQFKLHLLSPAKPDQQFVEGLKKFRSAKPSINQHPQKGIDLRTLERIKLTMRHNEKPCSAEQIAHLSGVSRSTARAYLEYLIEQGIASENLQYGTVGRPQRLFGLMK
ncbi:response regulator [Paenibacillus albiflavus]|uniref:Transcriptional regulatory protein n=1 Tax=Paenibacillus albiflavus TaxID=2545760 RepID=A0A4R4EA66_9BACL|nr:response regulator [Paenibacillus albiflavus]TCZ74715.1 response regulator [Paenibacillus albiflavus]